VNIISVLQRHMHRPSRRHCFLYHNTTIIEQPIDLPSLTSKLVMDAKAFIYDNQRNPFFLLFSLPQTHTPMFNSPEFRGKSKRGKCVLFGCNSFYCVIEKNSCNCYGK